MQVRILGSAAGGGFPQWNCACPNCRTIRAGKFPGKARSQAQVAVSEDGVSWFLLGASPDLRYQIEACPELHPHDQPRHSPICGVVLTSAELDQTLGLLLLREYQPLSIYASNSVRRILRQHNSMFGMLNRSPEGACWHGIRADTEFQLCTSGGKSGIQCYAVSLSTRYPAYVGNGCHLSPEDAVFGLRLTSSNGRVIAYFPSCGKVNDQMSQALQDSDLLLFDGTFYRDHELKEILGWGPRAMEMGHLPVAGEHGSLRQLAGISAKRKFYIHINNTNPMLNEMSSEYRAVRDAGWELAEDGWQAVL
jgi:pyrroloquinoline quinone biosynthesis protein B